MKIKLDLQTNHKLREKIYEINNFSFDKIAEFQYPFDKRGNKQKSNAFNCICAALERIDDLVKHCNDLNLTQTQKGTFALYDLFNYGQTLIDCISMIGNIYGIKYESKNDTSSFNEKGSNGEGNDEKYFKYLRSLCSVHPLATNAHSEYQGNQPEWCPYVNTSKNIGIQLLSYRNEELKNADYVATVYRNDMEFSKYIPIRVNQIFHYIKKRYSFINKIIGAIESYNSSQILELKNKHMLLPTECKTYDDYLKNLEDEIHIRLGCWEYQARKWRAIFKTHYDDELNEEALFVYKEELKKGITKVHARLQAMDFLDEDFVCDAIDDRSIEELKEYPYEMEKMCYLLPSYALENRETEDFSFIDEPADLDCLRMKEMLNIIDTARYNGATHKHLQSIRINLDAKYKTTGAEWARIQLKIMSPVLGKYISFDYFLNDWHLYLQVEIAKWLLLRNEDSSD